MIRGTNPSAIPHFALFGEAPTVDPGPPLHVETIRRRSGPRGWEITRHAHEGLLQAVVVRRGWVEPCIDGEATMLKGPAVICIPPGVVHAFRFDPEVDGDVVTFGPPSPAVGERDGAWPSMVTLFSQPRLLRPSAVALRECNALLSLARAETDAERPAKTAMLSALARGIVLWLCRIGDSSRSGALPVGESAARMLRFRELIDRHYREHREVAFYARAMGMTDRSLRRLCRDSVGVAPGRMLERRLALEARRRIIYTPEPISSIGYDLGFDDPAYFSRFMRRHAGLSPGDLRRSAQLRS